MIYQSDEELQAACEVWQKRLRLSDWIVKAKISRQRDVKANSQGHIEWVLTKKMASIHILDPLDYPPDSMVEQDAEQTLVHELLHLHFAPFDDETDTPKEVAIEQAVDSIAYGFVNLYRDIVKGGENNAKETESIGDLSRDRSKAKQG